MTRTQGIGWTIVALLVPACVVANPAYEVETAGGEAGTTEEGMTPVGPFASETGGPGFEPVPERPALVETSGGSGQASTGCLAEAWFADHDGDGFGDAQASVTGCEPPSGYTARPGDCDDQGASTHPDAAERCDGIDNDCDAIVDEPTASNPDCQGCRYVELPATTLVTCESGLSWDQARARCESLGLQLATVTDEAVNAAIVDQLRAMGERSAWLGLQRITPTEGDDEGGDDDEDPASQFAWLDPDVVSTFSAWTDPEPGDRDCAVVQDDARWHTLGCGGGQGVATVCSP